MQQLVIHRRGRLVDEAGTVEHCRHTGPLSLAQRPRLGPRRTFRPVHRRWRRGLPVSAVVAGLRPAGGPTRRPLTDQRRQLRDRVVDHHAGSLPLFWLSVASCSNSADNFPCTSITLRALSRSARRRSFSLRSFMFSRSTGSACGRPVGLANAANAAWSRCARHAETREEWRPSLRSNAPLPALSRLSYSFMIRALYA